MTNEFKACKEYFRAFARMLTRVNPEFCGLATKHGDMIHTMVCYYDDIDWDLGRFYLLKVIIEGYVLDEYIGGDEYKGGLVDYFESNFEYYQLVNLYNKIRLTVLNYPCCSRHKVWNKDDINEVWPLTLIPAMKIERWAVDDISDNDEIQDSEDSDEYWNSYDTSLEELPLPDLGDHVDSGNYR